MRSVLKDYEYTYKLSRPDLFNIPSTSLYLTKWKFKILDESFQIIFFAKK